jgi:hypothetical protein
MPYAPSGSNRNKPINDDDGDTMICRVGRNDLHNTGKKLSRGTIVVVIICIHSV